MWGANHKGKVGNSPPVKSIPTKGIWGTKHKGKVGNSPPMKSMPTKGGAVSCEGPITRGKLETYSLWRAHQQRAWQWAVRGQSQGESWKLTLCERHANKGHDSELWRANHKGKVGNSPTMKSTPTKGMTVRCEVPITRGKLETHLLWRAPQQRQWAMRCQSQGESWRLTPCEEHPKRHGSELWGANHKGKVGNSPSVKNTPTKSMAMSYKGPIRRERLETHYLWRACKKWHSSELWGANQKGKVGDSPPVKSTPTKGIAVAVRGQSQEESWKLTLYEEHANKGHGSKLWGANHKGKVGNSPSVKSTPTKGMAVSCEGPITREKLEAHQL